MPKYAVEYTQERFFRGWVEAENRDEALEMLFNGEVEDLECYGTEIQDSVDCKLATK